MFLLGWLSRYTVLVDRVLLGAFLLIFSFTPLVSMGLSGLEGAPDFHSRDFLGPWIWVFNTLSLFTQNALLASFLLFFVGKFCAHIYRLLSE